MTCPRCGKENEADARFCARCGLEFARYQTTRVATEGEMRCYRHPKVATNLSCGRCERPVCTRCAINGPAGIRCPECARSNVAFRPAAVIHSAGRSARSLTRVGPW
ncbi:zinc-ribbon domain-containing protein, partial [bacterium]